MKDFAVTFFADFSATTKTEAYLTLDELAAQIRSAKAATKTSAPWVKLARFGDKRSDKGCLRSDENLLAISGVEADYDGERFEFYKAVDVARCAGLAAILYTSPTHRPERPRWRVLCPSSTELLPAHRPRLLNRLHGLYARKIDGAPCDVFAAESWTLSQSYYFGQIARSPHYRVAALDGIPIDLLEDLDEIARGRPGSDYPRTAGQEGGREERDDAELVRRIVTCEGYHVELTALAARYVGRNVDLGTVRQLLSGLMLAQPASARDARWHDRYASIGAIVASAARKFVTQADRRRSIAALTHRLIRAGYDGTQIKAELIAEAERCGMDQTLVLNIGGNILRGAMETRRHG
jgi:hypothetical protein